MNDFWGFWSFWNILFVAVAIWIFIPIWIYVVVKTVSVAWYRGKLEAQKEISQGDN